MSVADLFKEIKPATVYEVGVNELRAVGRIEAPLVLLDLRGLNAKTLDRFERALLQTQIAIDKPFGFRVSKAITLERCL